MKTILISQMEICYNTIFQCLFYCVLFMELRNEMEKILVRNTQIIILNKNDYKMPPGSPG